MGEFMRQLFDGGPPVATKDQIVRARARTVEMLAQITAGKLLRPEEDIVMVSFPFSGARPIPCGPLSAEEITRWTGFGRRLLVQIEQELVDRAD
jgi:hypothetical protein